jgi:hypothetical protein
MALGADLHPDVILGGTGHELAAAGAAHGSFNIVGMDIVLHKFSRLS